MTLTQDIKALAEALTLAWRWFGLNTDAIDKGSMNRGDFTIEDLESMEHSMHKALSRVPAMLVMAGKMGWQPMETAPTDGTVVIGAIGSHQSYKLVKTAWTIGENHTQPAWCSVENDIGMLLPYNTQPSYWMPLPPVTLKSNYREFCGGCPPTESEEPK